NIKQNQYYFFKKTNPVIKISGKDSLLFLQRMSTNDMSLLNKDQPIYTCFTDNKGRLIDFCLVVLEEENVIKLLTSHEQGNILLDWLNNFHFAEDFTLALEETCLFYIIGAKAAASSFNGPLN